MLEPQVKSIRKYKLEELPAEITIDWDLYQSSQAKPSKAILGLGILFLITGIIIAGVGGWFMAFGPSSILYNSIKGMTFIQMLQFAPGPTATIGFVLIMIGRLTLSSQNTETTEEWLAQKIDDHLSFDLDELPENQKLYIKALEQGKFEIGLNEE